MDEERKIWQYLFRMRRKFFLVLGKNLKKIIKFLYKNVNLNERTRRRGFDFNISGNFFSAFLTIFFSFSNHEEMHEYSISHIIHCAFPSFIAQWNILIWLPFFNFQGIYMCVCVYTHIYMCSIYVIHISFFSFQILVFFFLVRNLQKSLCIFGLREGVLMLFKCWIGWIQRNCVYLGWNLNCETCTSIYLCLQNCMAI